jgi:hypothetical protein
MAAIFATIGAAITAYVAEYGLMVLLRVAPAVSTLVLAVVLHLVDSHLGGNILVRAMLSLLVIGFGVSVFALGFEIGQFVPKFAPAAPAKS